MQQRTPVAAAEHWSRTGLRLEAGVSYRLTASGTWRDWHVETTAAGYTRWYLAPFGWLRRAPRRPWFELMGCLDADPATTFPIGAGTTYVPPWSGELVCFANDVSWAYGNNSGAVTLGVERAATAAPTPTSNSLPSR
jgi:hypothetical protein